MIDKSKFSYNIGDIIETVIQGYTYRAVVVAYCFGNHIFNDYTDFYCYGVIILDDLFIKGHNCSGIAFDFNGNKIVLKNNKGWYTLENNMKLIKPAKAFIFKVLQV